MIVIPAIDIMNGKCVRLTKGRFDKRMTYEASPLETAKAIEAAGIAHLHLIDLDGAKTGVPANLNILESIASQTGLHIDFGGGIRCMENIQSALDAGANKINLGTFLFSNEEIPRQCILKYGAESLIGAVDVDDQTVAVDGWQKNTGMTSKKAIEALLLAGWKYISVTDIQRDGTFQGPNPEFYQKLVQGHPKAKIIGGGGVASIKDLEVLRSCGLFAAVTGKALFEGRITLKELAKF